MQKQAITPSRTRSRTIAKTAQTEPSTATSLKNAAMVQRQVGSRINSPSDGLDQKIHRFLDDLKNFKIPSPDAQKQMEQMQAGVEQIRQQNLGPAEQGLTRATKSLEGDQEPGQPSKPDTGSPKMRGRSYADGAQGVRDQPEGDRRGAREDARGPERVRDVSRRGQGRAEPAQGAGAGDQADGRGRHQARPHGQDPRQVGPRAEGRPGQPRLAAKQPRQGVQDLQAKMDEMAKRLDEPDPLAAAGDSRGRPG